MIRRSQLRLIALATVLVSTASVAHAQTVVAGYGNHGRTNRTYSYQGRYHQPTGNHSGGYTRQWSHTYYGGQPTTKIYGGHPGTWQPAYPPAPRGEWCGTGLPQRRLPKQQTFKIILGSDGIQFVDARRPGRGPRGNGPRGNGRRDSAPRGNGTLGGGTLVDDLTNGTLGGLAGNSGLGDPDDAEVLEFLD